MGSLATPVTSAVPAPTSTLDKILTDLEVATQVFAAAGALIPGFGTGIAAGATIAAKLESIVQAALNAHQAIMGKPLDLTLLKDEAPVT
jgi:hypothetical protein